MPVVLTTPYHPPVDQLLALGDCRGPAWPHYGAMGFGPEHVPELIRMSTDPELNFADSDENVVWAPIHAARILGMLRAPEAVEPLLEFLQEMDGADWPEDEFPWIFGQIGPAAIPTLASYLGDRSKDVWNRITVANGLEEIVRVHPETRAEVISRMVQGLESARGDDIGHGDESELAGFLISCLLDLKAVEAAPAMERAFADERVDLSFVGDWEDVQVALGLLPERITPRQRILFHVPSADDWEFRPGGDSSVSAKKPGARAQQKAKRKQQKESRRKNRRRKK